MAELQHMLPAPRRAGLAKAVGRKRALGPPAGRGSTRAEARIADHPLLSKVAAGDRVIFTRAYPKDGVRCS